MVADATCISTKSAAEPAGMSALEQANAAAGRRVLAREQAFPLRHSDLQSHTDSDRFRRGTEWCGVSDSAASDMIDALIVGLIYGKPALGQAIIDAN